MFGTETRPGGQHPWLQTSVIPASQQTSPFTQCCGDLHKLFEPGAGAAGGSLPQQLSALYELVFCTDIPLPVAHFPFATLIVYVITLSITSLFEPIAKV